MVVIFFFLISVASLTHLLSLFCSMPIFVTFHLISWSVHTDLWTDDSNCLFVCLFVFLLALVTTDLLTFPLLFCVHLHEYQFAAHFSHKSKQAQDTMSKKQLRWEKRKEGTGQEWVGQGVYFLNVVMICYLKKSLREETQLATPKLLLTKDQPVWVVAASSHVEKADRCHWNLQ